MAVKKTVTTHHGFVAIDAYHRIENVTVVDKNKINFHVRLYVDKNKPFFDEAVFISVYDIDGANPIKQAYDYIKTLPEFEGATDC